MKNLKEIDALRSAKRGLLVLSLSVCGVLNQSARASDPILDEDDRVWAKTTVDRALLDRYIKDIYGCEQSPENFLGCIRLVNSLGGGVSPQVEYVSKDIEKIYPTIKMKILDNVGDLRLAEIEFWAEEGPATPQVEAELEKKSEQMLAAAVHNTYFSAERPHIEFDPLIDKLLNRASADHNPQRVIARAINALIAVHDGHGRIDSLEHVQDIQRGQGDREFGIGALIKPVGQNHIILSVINGSPAEASGLRAGDMIVKVDNFEAVGKPYGKVIHAVTGPRGDVRIWVKRDHQLIKDPFVVNRQPYVKPRIDAKIILDLGRKLGYIRVRSLVETRGQESITESLNKAFHTFEAEGIVGVILDLSDCGGGDFREAQAIAGRFFGKKLVFSARNVMNGKSQEEEFHLFGIQPQSVTLPLAVIINGNSASAAEILASAIQDHNRGWIIGSTSYGKGSIQGSSMVTGYPTVVEHVTTRRFYRPSGQTIQKDGVHPDFEAFSRPDPSEEDKFFFREEDETPYALAAEGPMWTRPTKRQEVIERMKTTCLKPQHRAESIYAQRAKDEEPADFAVLKAEEVLDCSVDEPSAFDLSDAQIKETNNDIDLQKDLAEANSKLVQPGEDLVQWLRAANMPNLKIPAKYKAPTLVLVAPSDIDRSSCGGDDDGPAECDMEIRNGSLRVSIAYKNAALTRNQDFLSKILVYMIRDIQLSSAKEDGIVHTCNSWVGPMNVIAMQARGLYRYSLGLPKARMKPLAPPSDCKFEKRVTQ